MGSILELILNLIIMDGHGSLAKRRVLDPNKNLNPVFILIWTHIQAHIQAHKPILTVQTHANEETSFGPLIQ